MSKVACPRCGQDYLVRVRLVVVGRDAILCPECEALWLDEGDVAPPTEGSFGQTWFDYETFMIDAGRAQPHGKGELEVVEPFSR